MMMISEINALFDLIQKTASWLQPIVASRREKDEKQAAYILKEATVLVGALELLSNSWRKVIGQLLLFDLNWTIERREQARQEITAFLLEEVYIPEISKARSALNWYYVRGSGNDVWRLLYELPNFDHEEFGILVNAGQKIYDELSLAEQTPMTFVEPYTSNVMDAETEEQARMVRGQAERLLQELVDPHEIAKAQVILGKLRAAILSKFPSLPRPDW